MRHPLFRLALFALGCVLVGSGIAALLRSGFGVAPFDVANSGLAHLVGIDVGTASWIVSGVLVAAAWVAGRRPRAGTLVAAFAVGLTINLALGVLGTPDALALRLLLALAGFAGMWCGIVAAVCADLGAGPAEELMLALVGRGLPMREVRWGIEVVLFGAGWLMGGAAGVGSVAFVVATGPVLAFAVPRASTLLHVEPTVPPGGAPAELR